MTELTVEVRELKAKLIGYLECVKAGHVLVVTERGKPVGRIMPIEPTENRVSLSERMRALEQVGLVTWSGRKLSASLPRIRNQSGRLLSDLLLEDRE